MRNFKTILLLILIPFFLLLSFIDINAQAVSEIWNGTVSWIKTSKSGGKRDIPPPDEGIYRWNHFFEFRIDVRFVNGKGTVIRKDITTNWEKDSVIFTKPDNIYLIEVKTTKINCDGKKEFDLSVEFAENKKSYWISFFTPSCPEYSSFQKISNLYPAINASDTNEHQGNQITLPANFSGQPIGINPNVLSGTFEEIIPAPNNEGGGEIITKATWSLRKKCPPWKDPFTDKRINTLSAKASGPAARFIKRVNDELCIHLRVANGLRTKAEQDALWQIGRDKNGKIIGNIVTNAKGGQSNHNSGMAIDVYLVYPDGTIGLDEVLPPEVIEIARQEGFEWGGNWKKFKDYPHFEIK